MQEDACEASQQRAERMTWAILEAIKPAANASMQDVVRQWWIRAALSLLRAALTVLQFALLLFVAVLCAKASPLNNNLWGVVFIGGVYSAISLLRLKLNLGLPGLIEETPGERVLFLVQVVAFGGLAFTVSSHELARWGWAPMACSAVLHMVLKGGYWTIYSPAHQTVPSVKKRLIMGGVVFALVFGWVFMRWFDEWDLLTRLIGATLTAYVAASATLGMRALTRVLRDGMRVLPGPATQADYDHVHAEMVAREQRTGRPAMPLLDDVNVKNTVSIFSRLLFGLVLVPLVFVVGLPLPLLYGYVLLRPVQPPRVVEPPAAPLAVDQLQTPWPKIASLAAGQVLIAGGLAGGTIFGLIMLASHQAAWLGSPKLCAFLAVFFGAVGAIFGVLWGASLTAELVNERLGVIAVQASGQLVKATAERVGWAQRGLTLNEVEQVIWSSVGAMVQLGHARGGAASLGASLLNWVVRRFVAKTRDGVFAIARRQGRNDVTVWDIEVALREGIFKTVGDRVEGYLRAGRSVVQTGYVAVLVPCVIGVAFTGAVAKAAARADTAANACDSSCFYNARCHLLRSGRGSRLPCCEPIGAVGGEEHARECRAAH